MCTVISKNDFVGRNMDLEYHFNEQVVVVARNKELSFKKTEKLSEHYALIGMGSVIDDYPLFAEAMNEHGLFCAGLNFYGYAKYNSEVVEDKLNLTPYEIILWVLAKYKTVSEVKDALVHLNVVAIEFKENLPLPTLHWIVSDKTECIVIEVDKDGLHIYDNPLGILTNNPTFPYHLENIKNYLGCQAKPLEIAMLEKLDLKQLGEGAGGFGLPGDASTTSRFVRATFAKFNLASDGSVDEEVAQIFHSLDNVQMIKGNVITTSNHFDMTLYSSVCHLSSGSYYYKTYYNNQISVIDMHKENLDGSQLIVYPLQVKQQYYYQNDISIK